MGVKRYKSMICILWYVCQKAPVGLKKCLTVKKSPLASVSNYLGKMVLLPIGLEYLKCYSSPMVVAMSSFKTVSGEMNNGWWQGW